MAWGIRGLIVIGAVFAAGLAASVAEAVDDLGRAHGVHYFLETGDDLAPVDLNCAGRKPTGGGFEQPSIAGEPFWSFPIGGASWRVFMHVPTSGAQTVNAYVICKQGELRYPEKELEIGAGKTKSAKVACPGSTHVTGGGGNMTASGGDGWINSSYPYDDGDRGRQPDDGWKVRIHNEDGDSHSMQVNAICQKRQPRYADESINLPPGSSSAAIPRCRSSDPVIGAGIRMRGEASSGIPRALLPTDIGDTDDVPEDGVLANGSNELGAPDDKKLTGYAICERR